MLTQVVNNCQGPHYIHGLADKGKPAPLIIIQPGLNLVDSKQVTDLRKINPQFALLFSATVKSSRAPEDMRNAHNFGKPMLEVRGKELDEKVPIAALPNKEAIEMVRLTENTDLLKDWLSGCEPGKNADLIKAINARMKEVTSGIASE